MSGSPVASQSDELSWDSNRLAVLRELASLTKRLEKLEDGYPADRSAILPMLDAHGEQLSKLEVQVAEVLRELAVLLARMQHIESEQTRMAQRLEALFAQGPKREWKLILLLAGGLTGALTAAMALLQALLS